MGYYTLHGVIFPRHISELDECDSSPCANHGTCHDYINFYNCTCLEGFAGVNCDLGKYTWIEPIIIVTSYRRHGVLNHQQLDCSFNICSDQQWQTKETRTTGEGNPFIPVAPFTNMV